MSDSQRHVRAHIQSGTIRISISPNTVPLNYSKIDTEIEADCLSVRWDRDSGDQALTLLTEEGGDILYRESPDEGASWSMPTTIASGPGL